MMKWIAEFPTTNGRIVVTLALITATVAVVLIGIMLEKKLPFDILCALFSFEAVLAGVDYKQYGKKRDTHIPAPPEQPDVEDAKVRD